MYMSTRKCKWKSALFNYYQRSAAFVIFVVSSDDICRSLFVHVWKFTHKITFLKFFEDRKTCRISALDRKSFMSTNPMEEFFTTISMSWVSLQLHAVERVGVGVQWSLNCQVWMRVAMTWQILVNSASRRMKIHQKVHDDNVDTLSKNRLTYLKIVCDMWTNRFLIESVSLMRHKNTKILLTY